MSTQIPQTPQTPQESGVRQVGVAAERLTMQNSLISKENLSLSFLSAISLKFVQASQLVEGGLDSTVFEHLIDEVIKATLS
jgi:hypothetical protein